MSDFFACSPILLTRSTLASFRVVVNWVDGQKFYSVANGSNFCLVSEDLLGLKFRIKEYLRLLNF